MSDSSLSPRQKSAIDDLMRIATEDIAAAEARGAAAERGRVRKLVQAVGCICHDLRTQTQTVPVEVHDGSGATNIKWHDSRCPRAIALAIEARGEEGA